jgi:hypothetical protein
MINYFFRDVVSMFKSRWFRPVAIVCSLMLITYMLFPPYSFHPFCTYDLTYRLHVTLEAEGKQYSSEVVRQKSRSRHWIAAMGDAGCMADKGTALAFRLGDNRLVLLSSNICLEAERKIADYYVEDAARAMREHRKVEVTSHCAGISRSQGRSLGSDASFDDFLIDNADKPTRWRGFKFDNTSSSSQPQLRIVTAVAEAADISPKDNLDKVAPEIFKTQFKHPNMPYGPEPWLPYSRRSSKPTHLAYQY